MAHALSLAEVVDVTAMSDAEERWWKLHVRSAVDATLLEPVMERQRSAGMRKVRDVQWDCFARSEDHRLRYLDRADMA